VLSCSDELRIQAALPTFELSPSCAPAQVTIIDTMGGTGAFINNGQSANGSNLGNPPGYNDVAAGFNVAPGQSVRLESLSLVARRVASGNMTISVVGDRPLTGFGTVGATSEPDLTNVLETWSVDVTASVPTLLTLSSAQHPVLAAGARYWVVMAAADAGSQVHWNSAPTGTETQFSAERNQLYISWGYSPTSWMSVADITGRTLQVIGTPV
jgi:hypothetical protein